MFSCDDQPQDTGAPPLAGETGGDSEDQCKKTSPLQRKKKVRVISPKSLSYILNCRDDNKTVDNRDSKCVSKQRHDLSKTQLHHTRKKIGVKHLIQISDSVLSAKEKDAHSFHLPQHLQLPIDQYEVTLTRRAIYKKSYPLSSSDQQDDIIESKDIGDTSLGMKLTILSGKVIVQALVPLKDGRASPAQLTGMIQKGDVLLSIDGKKLVGLGMHLELLIERLKPLSEPVDGYFRKKIRICFAVGQGLKLLKEVHNGVTTPDYNNYSEYGQRDVVEQNDFINFSKYTMVDNLTGLPFFHDYTLNVYQTSTKKDKEEEQKSPSTAEPRTKDDLPVSSTIRYTPLLNEFIAMQVSIAHEWNTSMHRNGYFNLGDFYSSLLRSPIVLREANQDFSTLEKHIRKYRTFEASHMLNGAKSVFNKAESGPEANNYIDPLEVVRNECRTFSSRSRFSSRYAKFIANQDDSSLSSNEQYSLSSSQVIGSEENMNDDDIGVHDLDDDGMLIQLAAWNKKWKDSMVLYLEAASLQARELLESKLEYSKSNRQDSENELEKFLFGDKVVQLMSSKRTLALPPDEITEVLFDLSTQVRTILPMTINLDRNTGMRLNNEPLKEVMTEPSYSRREKGVLEATVFLTEKLLPMWLQTFKPIQPTQRRVVWPLALDKTDAINLSDELSKDSSVSVCSDVSYQHKQNLEGRVADIELDPETRVDTCELVTFYFTRKLLNDIRSTQYKFLINNGTLENLEDKAVSFIEIYGSYLNLPDSFISVSHTRSLKVIHSLIKLSSLDPTHLHCLKLFEKCDLSTQIYEKKLLSCLVSVVENVRFEEKSFESILHLAVKAYPDFKPWQVRCHLSIFSANPFGIIDIENISDLCIAENNAYYKYLSFLMETHYTARMDAGLVQEWCLLSTHNPKIGDIDIESRLANFIKVADPTKQKIDEDDDLLLEHRSFFVRDLSFLLDTALLINKVDVALKIEEEIILDQKSSRSLLNSTLQHLRNSAFSIIASLTAGSSKQDLLESNVVMKQVLLLMEKLSLHPQNQVNGIFFDLSLELKDLLACASSNLVAKNLLGTMVSSISPVSLLDGLIFCRELVDTVFDYELLDFLRKCLENLRNIETKSLNALTDISLSLNRVENIRHQMRSIAIENIDDIHPGCFFSLTGNRTKVAQRSVWSAVKEGDKSLIDK